MTVQTFEITNMSPARRFQARNRARQAVIDSNNRAKNEVKAKLTKLFESNRKQKLKAKNRRKK